MFTCNFQNGKASLQKFLPDQRTNIQKWFTTRREEIFFALNIGIDQNKRYATKVSLTKDIFC